MFKRAVHPCVILKEPSIALAEFARQIDVPANRVLQIISGEPAITGDTASQFGHWFGTDAQF